MSECCRLAEGLQVLALAALVRMKLTSFRLKDRVHLQDLIEVGLVTEADLPRLPAPLAARLRDVLRERD